MDTERTALRITGVDHTKEHYVALTAVQKAGLYTTLTLFWARALASCQVTPTLSRSCSVERLQLIFGLPCLLFPCGL